MNNQLSKRESKVMLKKLGITPLPTEQGDWTYIVFGDSIHGNQHHMLVFGDLETKKLSDKENILVRIHSSCYTSEIFGAINCECRPQLHEAMRLIRLEGNGIILYLDQEGRGNGIVGKLAQLKGMFGWENGKIEQKVDKAGKRIDTDRAFREAGYPSEARDFAVAGEMLKSIGIKSVRLLTNNPSKIEGIERFGIKVSPVELHIVPENEIIAADLRAKANKMGHKIGKKYLKVRK